MSGTEAAGPFRIRVGTLNCRNTADRWKARKPLLVRQLVALQPDVIGLQELRRFPSQARAIGARARAGDLVLDQFRSYKTGLYGLWEGVAVLSRLPVLDRAKLKLGGQNRVAQRVTVAAGDGVLDFYNTHLASEGEEVRTRQAQRLLEWMAERPSLPQVLVGDFNARPTAPSIQLLAGSVPERSGGSVPERSGGSVPERSGGSVAERSGGQLRSAYALVHGGEPEKTVPTPLRVGATGKGSVLDFIFVNDLVEVHEAWRTFEEADPTDEHLVASDHYGLAASISVRPTGQIHRG